MSVTSYYTYSVSKSIGHCDEWETQELEREHLQCTRVVEERYTLVLEKFQVWMFINYVTQLGYYGIGPFLMSSRDRVYKIPTHPKV